MARIYITPNYQAPKAPRKADFETLAAQAPSIRKPATTTTPRIVEFTTDVEGWVARVKRA